MLDRDRRRTGEEPGPDQEGELPESEVALGSNSGQEARAARARAAQMSRQEAIDLALNTPASPLPHRAALEARFGADLSHVRAHLGPEVGDAVRALGAEAIAIGDDIAFADQTPSSDLVAHEVAHVVQHRAGHRRGEATDEAEAERVERGDHAVAHELAEIPPGGSGTPPELRKKTIHNDEIAPEVLEGRARDAGQDDLTDAQAVKAIHFNNRKWKGDHRDDLLHHLRGVAEWEFGAEFGAADVQAVARIQRGAGIPADHVDGMIGDTTMAILLHSGLKLTFDEETKPQPRDVQLLFYPGEFEDIEAWKAAKQEAIDKHGHEPNFNVFRATSRIAPEGTGRMYVKWKGNIVDVIDCRGGPPIKLRDGTHSADPSRAGTYKLGKGKSHVTKAWANSQIPWGAPTRERADGEIEFLDANTGRWKVATGNHPDIAEAIEQDAFRDANGKCRPEYRGNDFGKVAFRIEGSPGMFIHTSPADEATVLAGRTPVLDHSHGCLHVNPAERERLMQRGFLQGGVTLVIKNYDVHLLPGQMRQMMEDEEEIVP